MPRLYVDGGWVAAASGAQREVQNPYDQSVIGKVDEAGPADVDAAIRAARTAFDSGAWPGTAATQRGALLLRVADLLERDRDLVARRESLDTGKRLAESEYDVDDVVRVFRYYGGVAAEGAGRIVDTGSPDVVSRVVYEPVGVCALITPWNYPLLQASWKVAPALAAGCTFVLKPSELTPSTAIHLIRLLAEAGLPAGVANLVLGGGPAVGAALTESPLVDLVSFTGGLATGKRVMAAAAATVKKVALELGGKNPNIVFADADREAALDLALSGVFAHSGQVCSSGARLVVQDVIHDEFVAELVVRADRIRLGGPFDPQTETGSLISAAHLAKIEAYVAGALAEGATLACGGSVPDDPDLKNGFFYLPTILTGCRTEMRCVQDESFGPVLTVERFTDEDDAVRIANDTEYGLAGAVWTQDAGKAQRVARRL
ncbi:MAG TPA: aldehyde dehydrogenase family protein, partial [Actinomycetota bacterium]|nr:aldehyde dehydrogenase family protein [Actinomycetota bacterium]